MYNRNAQAGLCFSIHALEDGVSALQIILLPHIAESLGINFASLGTLRAIRSGLTFILEYLSGILSDRVGPWILLVTSLLGAGIGLLLLSEADSVLKTSLAFIVLGVAASLYHTPSSVMLSVLFEPNELPFAIGGFNSAGDFGKLFAAGLTGILIVAGFHWRSIVYLTGIVVLLAAGCVIIFTFRMLALRFQHQFRLEQGHSSTESVAELLAEAWPLLFVVLFISMNQSAVLLFITQALQSLGFGQTIATMSVPLILSGGVVGKAACGRCAAVFGPRAVLVFSLSVTAVGVTSLQFLPIEYAAFFLPLLGVFLQGSSSVAFGVAGIHAKKSQNSTPFGVAYMVSGAGGVLGPILIGFGADRFGLTCALVIAGGISAISIVPSLLLPNCCPESI